MITPGRSGLARDSYRHRLMFVASSRCLDGRLMRGSQARINLPFSSILGRRTAPLLEWDAYSTYLHHIFTPLLRLTSCGFRGSGINLGAVSVDERRITHRESMHIYTKSFSLPVQRITHCYTHSGGGCPMSSGEDTSRRKWPNQATKNADLTYSRIRKISPRSI